ncbi:hypothetical protein SteCoe_35674 [Stentor coeruleus]|uniref:Uncharacterized protein n=1 Tax=Stentor coeruleus TaxID=5963 RepID=A0A1R2ART0_9CILI|nr:hypothetical protein SteCoe_35674 [Stentor coeruleus]
MIMQTYDKDDEIIDTLKKNYPTSALIIIENTINKSIKNKLRNYYHKFKKPMKFIEIQHEKINKFNIKQVFRKNNKDGYMNKKLHAIFRGCIALDQKIVSIFSNIFNPIDELNHITEKPHNLEIINELKNSFLWIEKVLEPVDANVVGYLYLCHDNGKNKNYISSLAQSENIKEIYILYTKLKNCTCRCVTNKHALISIKNNSLYKEISKIPINTPIENIFIDKKNPFYEINQFNYKMLLQNSYKIIILFGEEKSCKKYFFKSLTRLYGHENSLHFTYPKKKNIFYHTNQNNKKISLIKHYLNFQNSSELISNIKEMEIFCEFDLNKLTIIFTQKSISLNENMMRIIRNFSQKYEVIRFIIGKEYADSDDFDKLFTVTKHFKTKKKGFNDDKVDGELGRIFTYLQENRDINVALVENLFSKRLKLNDKENDIELSVGEILMKALSGYDYDGLLTN